MAIKYNTLCLADSTFRNAFPNWQPLIEAIIKFCNRRFEHADIKLLPHIEEWTIETDNPNYDEFFGDLETSNWGCERVIGFTDHKYIRSNSNVRAVGRGCSKTGQVVIGRFFPRKIPLLYPYGLAKLTLHELGHTFGLLDTDGDQWTIMDYLKGNFTSRFNEEQIRNMREWAAAEVKKNES